MAGGQGGLGDERRGLGGSRLKLWHKPDSPSLNHSPSSSASCTSRRPSSSQSFIFRAKVRDRGAGDSVSKAHGQHRARAGAWGEAAGGGRRLRAGATAGRGGRLERHSWRIRFHEEEHSFGEKFGDFFFFFLILCMCNVISPAPWRSCEAQHFFLSGDEGLRVKCELQQSLLQFLQLGVSPSLPTSRRPSVILWVLMGSQLTIVVQMSAALPAPLSISVHSLVYHLHSLTKPLPWGVPVDRA